MCGIIGYISPRDRHETQLAALQDGIRALAHRGPDDRGSWSDVRGEVAAGLGHTRLSILDLTQSGHQPMLSASGRYAVAFNGEIYNFREVRASLEAQGAAFRSTGDTEVLLEAFARWGLAAVDRFVGMFALALFDREEQRMLLVRDRAGVKPLYYCVHDGTLAFASELRGLQAFAGWSREVDPGALAEFLQYGYIAAPRTIFRAVRALEPGSWVAWTAARGLETGRYWSLEHASGAVDVPRDESEARERLLALLDSACGYRLVSDVPVGVFLSGGIDSSLVTAVIAKRLGADTRTFTIGFDEKAYDESQWAAAIARHLGTRHTVQTLSMADAERTVDSWGDLFDEPFGDSSAIPTLLVSSVAREHVKVALSADGGDELFGGYTNYATIPPKIRAVGSVPGAVRKAIGGVLGTRAGTALATRVLPRAAADQPDKALDRVQKLSEALAANDPASVHQLSLSYTTPRQLAELVGHPSPDRPMLEHFGGSLEEAMMAWDFHHYLPGDILVKVDRMSMRVGLEAREPLLDHRLVEFAFACPLSLRRGELGSKHLLRSVLYELVPRELIDRPKQGFGIPLATWLRRGRLLERIRELGSRDSLRGSGLVDPVALDKVVGTFLSGGRIDPHRVWMLLAFELWRRRWLGA